METGMITSALSNVMTVFTSAVTMIGSAKKSL